MVGVLFLFYNFVTNTKGVITIVSKLYEFASAYDYEWAVPDNIQFSYEARNSKGKRGERCKGVSACAEQLGAIVRRAQPNNMAGND